MADNTEIIAKIRGDTSDYKKSLEDSQAYTKLWADLLNKAELDVTQQTIKAGEERIAARRNQQRREIEDYRKARNEEFSIARSIRQQEDAFYQGRGPDQGRGAGGGSRAGGGGKKGQDLMPISYFVDDLQYGFRGVANNIAPLTQSLGGSSGLAAALGVVAVEAKILYDVMGPLYAEAWNGWKTAEHATEAWTAAEVSQWKEAEAAREQTRVKERLVDVEKSVTEQIRQSDEALRRATTARAEEAKELARITAIKRGARDVEIDTGNMSEEEKVTARMEAKKSNREEDYKAELAYIAKKKGLNEQIAFNDSAIIKNRRSQAAALRASAEEDVAQAKRIDDYNASGFSKSRNLERVAEDKRVNAKGFEREADMLAASKKRIDNELEQIQAAEVAVRNKLRTIDQEHAIDVKRAGAEIDRIRKENLEKAKANIAAVAEVSKAGASQVAQSASEQGKKDAAKEKENAAAREQLILELRIQTLRDDGRAKQADALDREIRMKQEVNRLEKLGFDAAQARDLAKQQVDRELGKQRGVRTSNPRNTTGLDSATYTGLDSLSALQRGTGPRGNLARNPSAPGAMDDMVKSNNTAAARRSAERNSVKFDSFGQKAPGAAKPGENAVVAAINILTNVVKQGQNPTAPLKRS